MNMENIGNAKAHTLFFIAIPPNNAMAICGANPQGRLSKTLYSEQAAINSTKETIVDFESFMDIFLDHLNGW